jgi:hypothetical protein
VYSLSRQSFVRYRGVVSSVAVPKRLLRPSAQNARAISFSASTSWTIVSKLKAALNRWDLIPAIIYPETMDASWVLELEIIENLIRYDLSPEQKNEHTVRLAALYKECGEVQGANTKSNRGGRSGRKSQRSHSATIPLIDAQAPPKALPTTTQKLVESLGITRDTIQDRVAAVARDTGTSGLSVEKSSADKMAPIAHQKEIDKANKKAKREAEQKAKAKKPTPNRARPQRPRVDSRRRPRPVSFNRGVFLVHLSRESVDNSVSKMPTLRLSGSNPRVSTVC